MTKIRAGRGERIIPSGTSMVCKPKFKNQKRIKDTAVKGAGVRNPGTYRSEGATRIVYRNMANQGRKPNPEKIRGTLKSGRVIKNQETNSLFVSWFFIT